MGDPEATIHAFEQATAALLNMAVALGDYFKKLQEQGFSRDETFGLTVACQTALLRRVGMEEGD